MEHSSAAKDMCILVVSCDKYADCWEPFSLCLQKFWPDCPYPVYLATETKEAPAHTVYQKTLHSTNTAWTGRLREFCQQIDEPHVLFALEDQWIAKSISTKSIENVLGLMQKDSSLGTIYLDYTTTNAPLWKQDRHFYILTPGTPYRLSAGPSIWNRKFLLNVCSDDVDAWNFERIKSFSPETFSYTILCSTEQLYRRVPPLGAIRRGKWEPSVPAFCKENNLCIDLSHREVINRWDVFKVAIKSFIFNLNPPLIVKVQNWLYRLQHKTK